MPPGPVRSGRYSQPTQPAYPRPVQLPEDERIVHFSGVRFVAVGHAGNLHVADLRHVLREVPNQVTADDLQVIEVELQPRLGRRLALDDLGCERQPT